ncbi:HAD-IIA family hydrolase [Saccharibacillus sp. JS10]|uniref:HAD-IIA family hydrolase n=1 Tax=Saccharibacillus sp. JS10 TaxID=2950552 RepID=UPI0021095B46|nr:HAD-IIA family hydrolase [Saccharibacillus sp. JS10]MCQ4085608.1 HAD-IIA family hydrolase [Saccharibacillus sp. JS10]
MAQNCLLIDLDGTLYHGERMVPGADTLITTLNEQGIPFLFLTNNSSATPQDVSARLNKMGIPATPQQVCTSSMATAAYIAEHKADATVAVFGEHGLRSAITEAGLTIVDSVDAIPDYVVQGIDREFSYQKLAEAGRLILAGATFISTNPDLLLPGAGGLMPGAGTLGSALKAMTGTEPIVIGKPSAILMNFAFTLLNTQASEVTIIGDNMMTDIKAGTQSGCRSLLLLTDEGVTTPQNIEIHQKLAESKPDLIKHNLQEIEQWVLTLH